MLFNFKQRRLCFRRCFLLLLSFSFLHALSVISLFSLPNSLIDHWIFFFFFFLLSRTGKTQSLSPLLLLFFSSLFSLLIIIKKLSLFFFISGFFSSFGCREKTEEIFRFLFFFSRWPESVRFLFFFFNKIFSYCYCYLINESFFVVVNLQIFFNELDP